MFAPGAFCGTRVPRIVAVPGGSDPVGRVVDLVELRPGDPRLPERTPEGRRWPRAAGALVGGAVYNLGTDAGAAAYRTATAGPGPHGLTLGFKAARLSRRGRVRVIEAADVWTLAPAGVPLSRKDQATMAFETKAPGARRSRPWERNDDAAPSRRARRLEPGKIDPAELDELHDVDDDLALSLSPGGDGDAQVLAVRSRVWLVRRRPHVRGVRGLRAAVGPCSGSPRRTLQFRAAARNQRGEVVAAGRHLMYRLESAEVARG